MNIIYDWVSITSKIDSVDSMIEMIGLKEQTWETRPGYDRYTQRISFGSISILYGGMNEGVMLDMSGQGCRDFETYGNGDYDALFQHVVDNPDQMNITRLDIACDDKEGILPIDEMIQDYIAEKFVSRSRDHKIEMGSKGKSIYFGSRKSNIMIRIYDKAAERGLKGEHWIRVEMQLRRENAKGFISNSLDVVQKYYGTLNNYLRFVSEVGMDSNKRRWEIAPYWQAFIESIPAIHLLSKPGVEYNLSNIERYLLLQSGNNIETYINCVGLDEFLKKLSERKSVLNAKHLHIIQDYYSSLSEGKAYKLNDLQLKYMESR